MIALIRLWKSPSESELIARDLPEATLHQLLAFVDHEVPPQDAVLGAQLSVIGRTAYKGTDPKANRQQIAATWVSKHGTETSLHTFDYVEY